MKILTSGILIPLLLIFYLPQICYAQNTWTVSNDPSFNGDFTTVQDAVDAASAGDKIYVYGSGTSYAGFNVDKKLHLIGAGYWKSENMIPDQNPNMTYINPDINLLPGSDGTIIEGFYIEDEIIIDADTIICRYNRLQGARFMNSPNTCFLYGNFLYAPNGSSPLSGSTTGTEIRNNIMTTNGNGDPQVWPNSAANISCIVDHNALQYYYGISNCSVYNNIFDGPVPTFTNVGVPQHNIFSANVSGLDTTNLINVDINTVWNLANPSPDGKYQLIGDTLTNPAFGFADDGSDVGAYGGNTPYRLSGIVRIPSIYRMIIPLAGDTTNMLNVRIKAKSN